MRLEFQQHFHVAPRRSDGHFQRQLDTAVFQQRGQLLRLLPVGNTGGFGIVTGQQKTRSGKQGQLADFKIQLGAVLDQLAEQDKKVIVEYFDLGGMAQAARILNHQVVKTKSAHQRVFLLRGKAVQIHPDMTVFIGFPLLNQLGAAALHRATAVNQHHLNCRHCLPPVWSQ